MIECFRGPDQALGVQVGPRGYIGYPTAVLALWLQTCRHGRLVERRDERRGARPLAKPEHRNPPAVSHGTPYSSLPPSPLHIHDLQHVVAQNNHKIKAMQLQIDILEHRHNEHHPYGAHERMRLPLYIL